MSEPESPSASRSQHMKEYEFTCPACGQQIDVNETMREAIETNGCPVCAATVDGNEFEE